MGAFRGGGGGEGAAASLFSCIFEKFLTLSLTFGHKCSQNDVKQHHQFLRPPLSEFSGSAPVNGAASPMKYYFVPMLGSLTVNSEAIISRLRGKDVVSLLRRRRLCSSRNALPPGGRGSALGAGDEPKRRLRRKQDVVESIKKIYRCFRETQFSFHNCFPRGKTQKIFLSEQRFVTMFHNLARP